ncbi:MAG TPA: hypothetical protein VFT45_14075 [Longimicrobium sp.]|nr:hypothetical protein [Longimicrobium sp.]
MLSFLLAAGAAPASARAQPGLPACRVEEIEMEPCLAAYDERPVVASEPPLAQNGRRETPHVWMLVDETGAVRAAQIARSGGVDWDLAAIERAKQYRFRPALLAGRPTPAWIMLPVPAVPPPQTCADFDSPVPLSAGVAELADSTVFEAEEWGTAYHYLTLGGFRIDLFLYPAADHGPPEVQVDESIEVLRSRSVAGAPDSLAVLGRGRERVRLFGDAGGGAVTGQFARLRVWFGDEQGESYMAIFPAKDGFVKVRATYRPGRDAREIVAEFTRQVLSNQAWRERGCPRGG